MRDVNWSLRQKQPPHHAHHSQVSNHRDKAIVLKVFRDRALEQSHMIKSQDQTIKKLTKLLDQQQQLQLSTEAENKTLKHRVKKLTHVSTKNTKDNVLAFNNKNLSSIGKITKPKDDKKKKPSKQAQQKAKQTQAKKTKKAKKKSRHKKFWRRFFGK